MRIEPAGDGFAGLAGACDFSFTVADVARPPFDGPAIARIEPVPPRRKTYAADFSGYRRDADHLLLAAGEGKRLLGYLAASRGWNRFCHLDALAVDRTARGQGVGRALLEAAAEWGRDRQLAGLFAETQDDNIDACRFYERCGFVLAGFDRRLYAALPEHRAEIALFYYRLF